MLRRADEDQSANTSDQKNVDTGLRVTPFFISVTTDRNNALCFSIIATLEESAHSRKSQIRIPRTPSVARVFSLIHP